MARMDAGRGRLAIEDLDEGSTAATLPTITVTPPPLDADDFDGRYTLRTLLGRGGMGEVFLAKDRRIGREVALKATRSDGSDEVGQRFSRECRLQGQLEHPGLVPVYDVGKMPDGAPFFTMKRVRGVTLEDVLSALAKGDTGMSARFSRTRLLAVFVTICQTVHFAHRRGVIHRDLKPANVMLGDFGEVYVLDWGVAKVVASDEEEPAPPSPREDTPPGDADVGVSTSHGALLGTLGYMAPEQLKNAVFADARADVYSLGAILLELLTGERLHAGARGVDLMESTLASTERRVRTTTGEHNVPLELIELTVRATDPDLDRRLGSAEDFVRALERYLDGDRDLEARAKLAEAEARNAIAALDKLESLEAVPGPDAIATRAKALRRAGRALALDPSQATAQDVVLRLMVWSPPGGDEPADVSRETERRFSRAYQRGALAGMLLYASWLPLAAFLLLSRPLDSTPVWTWLAMVVLATVALALNAWSERPTAVRYFAALVACLLACFAATRIVGPYVLVPGLVTLTVMIFMLLARPSWHPGTVALGFLGLVLPGLLEALQLVTITTRFDADGMHVQSPSVRLDPAIASVSLLLGMALLLAVLCLAARWVQRLLLESARKAALEAWKLASLVPRGAVVENAPPSSRV